MNFKFNIGDNVKVNKEGSIAQETTGVIENISCDKDGCRYLVKNVNTGYLNWLRESELTLILPTPKYAESDSKNEEKIEHKFNIGDKVVVKNVYSKKNGYIGIVQNYSKELYTMYFVKFPKTGNFDWYLESELTSDLSVLNDAEPVKTETEQDNKSVLDVIKRIIGLPSDIKDVLFHTTKIETIIEKYSYEELCAKLKEVDTCLLQTGDIIQYHNTYLIISKINGLLFNDSKDITIQGFNLLTCKTVTLTFVKEDDGSSDMWKDVKKVNYTNENIIADIESREGKGELL